MVLICSQSPEPWSRAALLRFQFALNPLGILLKRSLWVNEFWMGLRVSISKKFPGGTNALLVCEPHFDSKVLGKLL